MFIYRQKQKGMVLICAVAILAVLSIMATSFVRMMTLNLQAAKNHLNYVDAKFTAIAGIENAKAIMWQYMLSSKFNADGTPTEPKPTNQDKNFWYPNNFNESDTELNKIAANKAYRDLEKACKYKKENYKYKNKNNQIKTVPSNKTGISLTETDNNSPFYYSGVVGRSHDSTHKFGRYEYNGNTYALKIQDNQGKLNLNSHRPYNINGTNHDQAVKNGNTVMNNIIRCLAEQCGFDSTTATNLAKALRDPNSTQLPNFSSMLEIEGIIDAVIPDPEDEDDPTNTIISQKLKFLDNVCITAMMDSNYYTLSNIKTDSELRQEKYVNQYNTQYYREYRSPVNINTASVELIAALIQAIESKTRVYMPKPATSTDTFDNKIKVETEYTYDVHTYDVSFTKEQAINIANYLLYKGTGSTENRYLYHSMLELESSIQFLATPISYDSNHLEEYYNAYNVRPSCFNITPPYTIAGYTDFCKNIWYNICADTLKANFNPNIRENFFNPDFVYRQYVQKSDLHNDTKHTYSTEFCFETYGHIDIQSIGKITANNKNLVVASSVMQESVGFSSITSLTTYKDFKSNDGASSGNIFPYNTEQDYITERQKSVGYIQAPFMTNTMTSLPSLCHQVHDGIMMQEIYSGNNINNVPGYDSFKKFNLTTSPITSNEIYQSSGSISFWFKPTEDGHSPLFCSLFSASHVDTTNKQYVPYPVQYGDDGYSTKSTYHDGIQMFAYKNTNQQIIVSRIFFCGYFNDNGDYVNGIKSLAVDVDSGYLPGQATYMVNGKSHTGIKRKYARVDCIISLANQWWCENEWNSLYISWDDSTGDLSATLTFDDGTPVEGAKVQKGENTTSQPKFCIINEKNPQNNNRIQINGMDRSQVRSGGNPDGRLFLTSTNLHFPGNTTINHLKKEDSSVSRSIPPYTDTISIPLKIKTDITDPNKNPFLNTNLKPETTWGIIGGLSWIAYPESSSSDTPYYIRTSIVHYENSATQLTTDVHTIKTSLSNKSIPYSYPDSKRIIRKSSGDTSLSCTIKLTNSDVHPTILDSISLQILYPYTVSSSILQ